MTTMVFKQVLCLFFFFISFSMKYILSAFGNGRSNNSAGTEILLWSHLGCYIHVILQ